MGKNAFGMDVPDEKPSIPAALLSCKVVDTELYPEPIRSLHHEALASPDPRVRAAAEGIDKPYSGSTKGTCQNCDVPVWIGPKTQAWIDENPSAQYFLCCPLCTAGLSDRIGTREDLPRVERTHLEDSP